MKEERLLPIGTKVFHIAKGEGVVVGHDLNLPFWAIEVKFLETGTIYQMTADGKFNRFDDVSYLSLTKYSLETGGFTPISDYSTNPKVGNLGYFWDTEKEDSTQHIILGKLLEIKDATHPYVSCSGLCWRHFSHDIPDHIKKQMQQ